MEDNYKIRVGITHGDINGVGYEVILKTFSDPTMLELCTPIIYGSPKVAAYHRKAMDIQTNFSIVNSASPRTRLRAFRHDETACRLAAASDDEAVIVPVDSSCQRAKALPSNHA